MELALQMGFPILEFEYDPAYESYKERFKFTQLLEKYQGGEVAN